MATLKNLVLGEVSGKIGHVVIKKRGNKYSIAHRPKNYRTPRDTRSVSIRNQFRTISNLARRINNIDLLKIIWRSEFPDGYTAYHKILTSNYHHFRYSDFAGSPVLTPKPGFPLTDPKVEMTEKEIIIKTSPILPDSGINFSLEKFIITASIFLIESPTDSGIVNYFSHRTGTKSPLETGVPLQLISKFNSPCALYSEGESIFKSWSVLITLDDKNIPVHYSDIIPWTNDSIAPKSDLSMDHPAKLIIALKEVKTHLSRSIPYDPLLAIPAISKCYPIKFPFKPKGHNGGCNYSNYPVLKDGLIYLIFYGLLDQVFMPGIK